MQQHRRTRELPSSCGWNLDALLDAVSETLVDLLAGLLDGLQDGLVAERGLGNDGGRLRLEGNLVRLDT